MSFFRKSKQYETPPAPIAESEKRSFVRPAFSAPAPVIKKKSLADFFKLNIHDISSYLSDTSLATSGKSGLKQYAFALKEPELGLFDRAELSLHADGSYDIVFHGKGNELNASLRALIAFCAENWGDDFMKKGAVANEDANDLNMGIFSRFWMNRLRVDNVYFTMTLTLYNLKPEK
jgi:hypothetical protein